MFNTQIAPNANSDDIRYNPITNSFSIDDKELEAFINQYDDLITFITDQTARGDRGSSLWLSVAYILMNLRDTEFGGDDAAFAEFLNDLTGIDASKFGNFDELTDALEFLVEEYGMSYRQALDALMELETMTIPGSNDRVVDSEFFSLALFLSSDVGGNPARMAELMASAEYLNASYPDFFSMALFIELEFDTAMVELLLTTLTDAHRRGAGAVNALADPMALLRKFGGDVSQALNFLIEGMDLQERYPDTFQWDEYSAWASYAAYEEYLIGKGGGGTLEKYDNMYANLQTREDELKGESGDIETETELLNDIQTSAAAVQAASTRAQNNESYFDATHPVYDANLNLANDIAEYLFFKSEEEPPVIKIGNREITEEQWNEMSYDEKLSTLYQLEWDIYGQTGQLDSYKDAGKKAGRNDGDFLKTDAAASIEYAKNIATKAGNLKDDVTRRVKDIALELSTLTTMMATVQGHIDRLIGMIN
jgi:hypothetical protein